MLFDFADYGNTISSPLIVSRLRLLPFLLLFGATYFFAEFGPNTTTFVYPAEIFPVRVRTTNHGIAAAAGKVGAFIGTYALTRAAAFARRRPEPDRCRPV